MKGPNAKVFRTTLGRIEAHGTVDRTYYDLDADSAQQRRAEARPYGWVVVRELATPINAGKELFTLMSQISQECFAAEWMAGTEHAVWSLLHGRRDSWGTRILDELEADLNRIRRLVGACGLWIVWDEGATEPRRISALRFAPER